MSYRELIYKGFVGKFLEGGTSSAFVYYGTIVAVIAACVIIPYLLGCINFSIVISKKKYHQDIRSFGSGNAGATNMQRTYGTGAAALTFLGDFAKAAVSVIFGICLFGGIGGYLAALFCMIGHAFPCFYGFKGGMGVAVSAGAILFLDWRIFLILFPCFVAIVALSKYISLGSVTCMFLFPLLDSRMVTGRMPAPVVLIAMLMAALVIYLHRGNIKRIYSGTESKISFSKKKNKPADGDDGDPADAEK